MQNALFAPAAEVNFYNVKPMTCGHPLCRHSDFVQVCRHRLHPGG